MKRIILLTLLLIVGLTAQAQQKKGITNRHEISVSIAGVPFIPYRIFVYDGEDRYRNDQDIYSHKKIHLPSFNAVYGYRFSRLFTLQCIMSYTGIIRPYEYLYTGKTVIKENLSQLTILPVARFNWSQDGRLVTLYSSIGLGLSMSWITNQNGQKGSVDNFGFPAFHFNPIGISVGRKLYGFAELQISSIGALHVGMGYRFNYKKQ